MENMTFEQALNRLEEIVQLLEKDTTSLDQSVDLFQEGIQLSNYCSKKINNVCMQLHLTLSELRKRFIKIK